MPSSKSSPGRARIMFAAFLIAGLVAFYLASVQPFLRLMAAKRWEQTPCVIDSSNLVHVGGMSRGTRNFKVEITYHYTFHGNAYTSDRYGVITGASTEKESKLAAVAQNPPGTETVCYVNPSNPAEAVLSRDWNEEVLYGLVGLLFAIIGSVGLQVSSRLKAA